MDGFRGDRVGSGSATLLVQYLKVEFVEGGEQLGDGADALVRHVDAVSHSQGYQSANEYIYRCATFNKKPSD